MKMMDGKEPRRFAFGFSRGAIGSEIGAGCFKSLRHPHFPFGKIPFFSICRLTGSLLLYLFIDDLPPPTQSIWEH